MVSMLSLGNKLILRIQSMNWQANKKNMFINMTPRKMVIIQQGKIEIIENLKFYIMKELKF